MLRAMIGLDHCLKNTPNTFAATSGLAITQASNGSSKGIIIDSNSAISTGAGNAGGNQPQWILDLTPFLVSGITSLTLGMRVTHVTAGNTGIFMYIGTEVPTVNFIQVLTYAQLPFTATGSSGYIEIAFDMVANTYTVYCDSVSIASGALSGTFLANLKLGKCTMIVNATGQQTAGVTSIRDIYLTDNIAGDGMTGRLGPQTIYPASVDVATGNGWVVSDGTTDLLSALNATQPANATVNSPVDKTPLVLSGKAFAPVGFKVKAVSLALSGQSRGDTPSNSKIEIALNGTTANLGNVTTPKVAAYNVPVKILPLAPDGSAWDLNKLDAMTITLTPDV